MCEIELPLIIASKEIEWVLEFWNWKETSGKVSGQWKGIQWAYL